MADFANYTPGEYAKEHIRITPATLADGRDFFYLDDDPEFVSGAKTRELKDPRPLDYFNYIHPTTGFRHGFQPRREHGKQCEWQR